MHYFFLPNIETFAVFPFSIALGIYLISKTSGTAPISRKRKWQILNFKTLAFFLLKTGNAKLTLINNQGTLKILYITELALMFTDGPLIRGRCLLHSAHSPKVRCMIKVGGFWDLMLRGKLRNMLCIKWYKMSFSI